MKIISLVTASSVLSRAGSIAVAILFFGLLIMSHETGHFLFAKLFGVKVNEFAFGMGPTLFSKKKGETKYAVHLFPIGGFVSMEGEDENCEGGRAFCNKPAWQRFIIIVAGAAVNLILGYIITVLMLAFTTGADSGIGTPQVLYFHDDAVSCNSGLKEGDVITEVNGKHIFSSLDVGFMMCRDEDGVMDLTVKREGEKVVLKDVTFETTELDGMNTIIFDFVMKGIPVNFVNVMKYSVKEAFTLARLVWISFFDLITGRYGISDLSGPIGTVAFVADAAQEASTTGWDLGYVLMLMALISINLGIFNLFPIPALDGGRLFFILIEMIFRKPVPQKYERVVHAVGMVILLAFMAVVSLSDIIKLVRGEF